VCTVVSGVTTITSLGTDSITAVDRDGQIALVDAARAAGVGHFIYVSYTRNVETDDPLTQAKRSVEDHLRSSELGFTILRPSYFMEMWLGTALGWDFAGGTARVLGSGEQRVNWISAQDVVGAIVACVDNPNAHALTIELGGPEAVSPLEVVQLAQVITGREITVEQVPADVLAQQCRETSGTDASIFPSLMFSQTACKATEPAPEWLRPRTTVEEYLQNVLG
jgi:uncharacterized protein YbjT (DUF2867 family)